MALSWFASRPGYLLLYRVNRRPLGQGALIEGDMPDDVYEHFARVLKPGYSVIAGRKHQRVWSIGGIERDDAARTLTGRLGWQPRDEELVRDWFEEEMDWVTVTAGSREHTLIPFGFDGETCLLARASSLFRITDHDRGGVREGTLGEREEGARADDRVER